LLECSSDSRSTSDNDKLPWEAVRAHIPPVAEVRQHAQITVNNMNEYGCDSGRHAFSHRLLPETRFILNLLV
jgi:hypothetical protein